MGGLVPLSDASLAHRKKRKNFIGVVGMQGTFRVADEIESYATREIGRVGSEYGQKRGFWL